MQRVFALTTFDINFSCKHRVRFFFEIGKLILGLKTLLFSFSIPIYSHEKNQEIFFKSERKGSH